MVPIGITEHKVLGFLPLAKHRANKTYFHITYSTLQAKMLRSLDFSL